MQGNVFATDTILAMLISCTRTAYSWDVVVKRVGSKLFDKRDNSDSHLLTVSEKAKEPPRDEGNSFNSPGNLAMEVTCIKHKQLLPAMPENGERKIQFPQPKPICGGGRG